MTQPPLDDAVRQQTRIERSQARPIIPAGLLRSGPSRRHTTPSGSRDDEVHHASGLDCVRRNAFSNTVASDPSTQVHAFASRALGRPRQCFQVRDRGPAHTCLYLELSFQAVDDYAKVAGTALAAGLSNVYDARSDHSVTSTLTRWGLRMTGDILSNELKEFWPDIRQKIRKP